MLLQKRKKSPFGLFWCAMRDFESTSCLPFCGASLRLLEPVAIRKPFRLSHDAPALSGSSSFLHTKKESFRTLLVRDEGLEPPRSPARS